MEPRTLDFVAAACSGQLLQGDPAALATRVTTDSRHAQGGDLFIALAGERFDGHDYLADVQARGARAVLVERRRLPLRLPACCGVIAVENTRKALGLLAARYRADFHVPMIVVAGSNGKSTTKELLAAVLRQRFATLWSHASFNNDIGVPLTLLQLERHHQAAVLEAGTNHPGELAALLDIIQPQYGVLTSIGREHLEFFGDLAGVAREEGVLAEKLPAHGRLFLNADTPLADSIATRACAALTRTGRLPAHDWQASRLRMDEHGSTFSVRGPRLDYSGDYRVNLVGSHQVSNALLAIAAGAELGLTSDEIRRGLNACAPLKMRLQVWEAHGVRVLDDAYNANADSMLAALQTLHDLPCSGRRIAVLGDMAELGLHTAEAHAEAGRRAAELGVHQLFAVGRMASHTVNSARQAGLHDSYAFQDVTEAARALQHRTHGGDLVLLKASRVSGLERIAEALRKAAGVACALF